MFSERVSEHVNHLAYAVIYHKITLHSSALHIRHALYIQQVASTVFRPFARGSTFFGVYRVKGKSIYELRRVQ